MIFIRILILMFLNIICIVNASDLVFGEIIKFPGTSNYWEIKLPHGSTHKIDSSGMNVSFKTFELYLHHSKRIGNSLDFYDLLPKELYDFNQDNMNLKITDIIEYNKNRWKGFMANLYSPEISEMVAQIYIVSDTDDVFTFFISSKQKKWNECQILVDNILTSIRILPYKNLLNGFYNGRMIVLNFPYSMPCIQKSTSNGTSAICITKENIQLFINIKMCNSAFEALIKYNEIKKISADDFSFSVARIKYLSSWEIIHYIGKDSSLTHSLNLLTCIARKGECIIMLHPGFP